MTRRAPLLLTTLLALALLSGSTHAAEAKCGPWCPELAENGTSEVLPLDSAAYEVDLFGSVAVGRLKQSFRNDIDQTRAVTYKFKPVAGLTPEGVEFRIDGVVVEPEKQPAPKREQRGRAKPSSDSRLQGLNISVGPESIVEVTTRFQAALPIAEGAIALRLPEIGRRDSASGPLPTGFRVLVHHDLPLSKAESRSHDVFIAYEGNRTSIELTDGDDLTGAAFELELAIGPEDDPTLLGYVGKEKDGFREALAVLTPPSKPHREAVRAKQVVFVLDTSGSMAKGKLEQARTALYESLVKLSPEDTYNIVEFDGAFSLMQPEPVTVETLPVESAAKWLSQQRPTGSTKLLPALAAAFAQGEGSDVDRHGMIMVLTDGNVEDPREVEQLLAEKLDKGRLFFIGIGEDVKQDRILRFAEAGRGTAAFSVDPEQLQTALAGLFDSVADPLAWDLEFDAGDAIVEAIEPSRIPDLYAGRPVTIRVRFKGAAPGELKVHANTMGGHRTFTSPIAETDILERSGD